MTDCVCLAAAHCVFVDPSHCPSPLKVTLSLTAPGLSPRGRCRLCDSHQPVLPKPLGHADLIIGRAQLVVDVVDGDGHASLTVAFGFVAIKHPSENFAGNTAIPAALDDIKNFGESRRQHNTKTHKNPLTAVGTSVVHFPTALSTVV